MADRVDAPGDWDKRYDDDGPTSGLPPFLLDPLGVLRRRWVWMLSMLLLGLTATGAVVYLVEPTYRATATLVISGQQIPENFVRSTVLGDTVQNIQAMIGRVLSQQNLIRLIEQLDLATGRGEEVRENDLVTELRAGMEVRPAQTGSRRGPSSITVEISYRSRDPDESADVANAIAGLFMEASIERRSLQASRTTAFLTRQLQRDEAELRVQSQAIAEFRRENRGVLPGELATSLQRLQLISERRHSITAQITATENRILTRQPQAAQKGENEILLEELRRQLARESVVNTDAHPNVAALRARVARFEEIVDAERVSGAPSFQLTVEQRELEQLKRQLSQNDALIEEINSRIDRTPAIGERLVAFEQKEGVLRERYLDSLRKVEQAELAESLESAQQGALVSIIDPARVPAAPDQPRWLLAAGGLGVALGLALALGFLLELIDPVIVDIAQLERLTGQPCLGGLPQNA